MSSSPSRPSSCSRRSSSSSTTSSGRSSAARGRSATPGAPRRWSGRRTPRRRTSTGGRRCPPCSAGPTTIAHLTWRRTSCRRQLRRPSRRDGVERAPATAATRADRPTGRMAQRALEQMKSPEATRTAGGNGPRAPAGNGGGSGWSREEAAPAATVRVGLWFLLTAVTMLFIAFTVAYAARRTAPDWTAMALPSILWVNTGLLGASSATLEWARRRGRRGDAAGVRGGLTVTTLFGAAFLVGQIAAWRELAAAGVFMATSPHSAFFHLLTAVHGLHLLGGLGVLGYALRRAAAPAPAGPVLGGEDLTSAVLGSVAIYWHFLTVLWLYVFFIIWS